MSQKMSTGPEAYARCFSSLTEADTSFLARVEGLMIEADELDSLEAQPGPLLDASFNLH